MKFLIKREEELKDFENSQSVHIVKNKKVHSGENAKGLAKWLFDKEISMDGQVLFIKTMEKWPQSHLGFFGAAPPITGPECKGLGDSMISKKGLRAHARP